jgi:hypothetical protein
MMLDLPGFLSRAAWTNAQGLSLFAAVHESG